MAVFRLVYIPVERMTQLQRVERRWRQALQGTFPMTDEDLDHRRDQFESLMPRRSPA